MEALRRKNMRAITAAVCVLLATTLFADANVPQPTATVAGSNVTIPLAQYEELRKSNENTSATVVDLMTVAGSFAARDLTVTFAGRSVGTRATTSIVSGAADLTLSACNGEALLLRAGQGAYSIVALAPSFTLRCDARLSGSDRLQMQVEPTVLAVRSAVSDGELVIGDEDDKGARAYTLVRQVVGGNETVPITATGRFLITLLPDTTRFRYVIQVHNPNRKTAPLTLNLASGEHLQQIDSSAPYEPKGTSYVFAMPPGDSTITLSGELQGTSFAPPVEASLQYVVVESHPLLRPALKSSPKRVSTGETGITTQYRGALAFEIGPRERISWNVTRLEALRAISYAVRRVTHTLFVPANGPVLGESQINLDNQGAPELVLPRRPEPTFVALQDEPVLMTRNTRGELTVPLSSGQQQVTVQHRQAIAHLPVVFARLEVPRLPVPATYTSVSLRYPEHWVPLWQSFATEATTWTPDAADLVGFLLLTLWTERVLALLSMKPGRRIVAALLAAFAASVIPLMLWAVILGCGFVTLIWIASQRAKITWTAWAGMIILAAVVLVVFAVSTLTHKKSSDPGYAYSNSSANVGRQAEPVATATGVTDTVASDSANQAPKTEHAEPRTDAAYQGLPAKFELPEGVRFGGFTEQMLAPDRQQVVTVVLLSMTLVTWVAVALALIVVWLLWIERHAVRNALRARLAAAFPATPAAV
jgi:hypothetical protein